MACEVSSTLPSAGVSVSVTSVHVMLPGRLECVPAVYAYCRLSKVPPDGDVQVTSSALSLPDVAVTVGEMLGISVLTVWLDDAADAPTAPVKLIRTWNWYSVAPARFVISICVSLCASESASRVESATKVHGAPPVAAVKSAPDAVVL